MKHKALFFIPLAALLFVAGCFRMSQQAPPPVAGRNPAPDFSLRDLQGKTVRLDQFKGKVVLLDFWATWCPPCRGEIPNLVDLYHRYEGKGFTIIGISVDEEGAKVVKPFVKEFKMDYPVLLADEQVQKSYPLQGTPTKVIVDKNGSIAEIIVGAQEISVIEKKIKPLL